MTCTTPCAMASDFVLTCRPFLKGSGISYDKNTACRILCSFNHTQVVCNPHFPSISPPCHAFMHVHISFDHILVEVQQLILVQLFLSWSPTRIPKADPDVNPHRDRWISNIAAGNITQFLYMITRNIRWILRAISICLTRWSPTFS